MVKSKSKMWFDVKNTIINTMLEVLAPNRCKICGVQGMNLCLRCKKYINLTNPSYMRECKYGFERIVVGGIKEGVLSEILKEYKYGGRRDYAEILIWKIEKIFREVFGGEKNDLKHKKIVIVPLPTTRKHIRQRGFDHIRYLITYFKNDFEIQEILIRKNDTVQVGQDARIRREQAKEAYQLNKNTNIGTDVEYVLFDDVWTTGASMRAGMDVLKEGGARKVSAIVVASNDYID